MRAGAGGTLLRGAAIPYGWLPSRCFVCGRLCIRFVDMAFANHLPMESTGNKTKNHFKRVWHVSLSPVNQAALPGMGSGTKAYTSAKGHPKYPACQVQHRLGQLNARLEICK